LMYERVCLCELLKIVVDTKHLNEWLRRAEEERSNQSHQGNRKYYWFGAKVLNAPICILRSQRYENWNDQTYILKSLIFFVFLIGYCFNPASYINWTYVFFS
jgi:hypothetical protein